MKNYKMILIVVGTVIAFTLMCLIGIQSVKNKAIILEEAVYTAESDIKVQEKRRVDLVYNLADSVQQYDKHESETLKELADGMGRGNQNWLLQKTRSPSTEKTIISRLRPITDIPGNFRPECSLIGRATKSGNLNVWIIRHPAMHRRICLKSDIMDMPTNWRKR